jgi:hypothetical protein
VGLSSEASHCAGESLGQSASKDVLSLMRSFHPDCNAFVIVEGGRLQNVMSQNRRYVTPWKLSSIFDCELVF